jgi:hypothetical protein
MAELSLNRENARAELEKAAASSPPLPRLEGSGIIMAAGGPFVPSAYVGVRLLRRFGVTLPIEIWHAGPDEIPEWGRRAFEPWGVTLRDVMPFVPGHSLEQMRGWPIKPAALMNSGFRHVLFLDADCFPLRRPDFLFDTPEYRDTGALFWPDSKHHKMTEGASIWELTGLPYQGDTEFETGIVVLDKQRCWRELTLAQWMNANSGFWYQHVMGDKDTFYVAWRKLGAPFFLAPPCRRHTAVVTRHFWTDGAPLADHRTGTSKYALPTRKGPLTVHLTPYRWRPAWKNVYDELMQRFMVKEFDVHVGYLRELASVHDAFERQEQAARTATAASDAIG